MNIQTVVSGYILAMEVADNIKNILSLVSSAMDSIENQGKISGNTLSGESKKEWVIAYIKSIFTDVRDNWITYSTVINAFIDNAKSIFNFIKSLK